MKKNDSRWFELDELFDWGFAMNQNTSAILITTDGAIGRDRVVAGDGRSGFGTDHRSLLNWRQRIYYSTLIMQLNNVMAIRLFWDVPRVF